MQYLTLEPGYILKGQVWRIVTWLIIPPASSNLFFTLIMLYFYYSIGRSLEYVWGTYKLNLYLISGLIFTVLGSILLYIALSLMGVDATGLGYMFSTYYVNMSLFLAYAATFPDAQVLFFFIIPIKVKVLGIIYGVFIIIEGLQSFQYNALYGAARIVVIGASLLNFVIFFISQRKGKWRSPKQVKRQMEYRHVTKSAQSSAKTISKHKCAVCGRSDESNPELEFRFCSKCNGNYEYCSDHLFTHEHIK